MFSQNPRVTVIGGGLAGSEAAWQIAQRGIDVTLIEMRPTRTSPAHHTDRLAELVCSNSFKSDDPDTAAGMLKRELTSLGSMIIRVARETAVPAGAALAVDRARFAGAITDLLTSHPRIDVIRAEAEELPTYGEVILATGPLTSPGFERCLTGLVGDERLAFYDAAAPIVEASTIDFDIAFAASRYGKGDGDDYINCPMTRTEYEHFIEELTAAERVTSKDFENQDLFQACQPIEEIARRSVDAARFGPMKPVGLTDPRTGERPWAVVQLRAENQARTAYNIVGFQTNLRWREQERVFRLIPGLQVAEFVRYGVMHRNTFVDAPRLLTPTLALRSERRVRIAGQLSGTEGYLEAVGSGLVAAYDVLATLSNVTLPALPVETALGALLAYATDTSTRSYQPMHVNMGILPPLDPPVRGKRERYAAYSRRAAASLAAFIDTCPITPLTWSPGDPAGSVSNG